ncbi:hypothetical protein ACJX0J_033175 [Zea mays]
MASTLSRCIMYILNSLISKKTGGELAKTVLFRKSCIVNIGLNVNSRVNWIGKDLSPDFAILDDEFLLVPLTFMLLGSNLMLVIKLIGTIFITIIMFKHVLILLIIIYISTIGSDSSDESNREYESGDDDGPEKIRNGKSISLIWAMKR